MRRVITPVICLVVLLAIVVVGHAQAQSRKDEPAVLRFEVWQLSGLLVIPFVLLSHGLVVTRAAAVIFVVLLGVVFLLRRRRADTAVDF
jgi:flagellin-like protein